MAMVQPHESPCEDLLRLEEKYIALKGCVEDIDRKQDEQDNREGRMMLAVSEARTAAINARDAALDSRDAANRTDGRAERIEQVVCSPANALLAKYHSSNPPPELIDCDGDIPTSVCAQYPMLSEQRIHKEKSGRIEAEKLVESLGAEKERIRLAGELELARIKEATKLREEQIEREKRNAKLIATALATLGMIATAFTTWLASRGH